MKRLVLLLVMLTAGLQTAQAEQVTMPIGSAERQCGAECPERGMTKSMVQKRLGDPVQTRPAVGDPPISRWEYAAFTVYFEYDKVIHTVIKPN